jgi:HSP90 family molecular chaperone
MPDLELEVTKVETEYYSDVLYMTTRIKGVNERSLNEQAEKILPYISIDKLMKELDKRDMQQSSETKTKMKERIEELEGALEDIKDCALGAL